ncbi:MAG: membrane protein insertion efficiency factor YidD [Bacteroidota bacterium]|nr:membrane protein insertion efficiency factor YidD [Bacteroidota bacterium]
MNKIIKYFLVLLLFTFSCDISFCQSERDAPSHQEIYGSGSNVFIDFYQEWLSPIKGGNTCPMYPSCSQYSKILFQTQPIHEAYIGTLERVLRCGHELYLYPKRMVEGRLRWYDPSKTTFPTEYESFNGLNTTEILLESYIAQNNSKISVLNESTDEQFAEYLVSQKEYYRASTEYMRLHFYATDSSKKLEYLRKIGLCYYYDADYDGYEQFIKDNRQSFSSNQLIKTEMELLLGKIYYYQKKYLKAISTFEWSGINIENPFYNELQFCIGLSYARLFQWENVIKYFAKVDSLSYRGNISKTLCDSLITVYSLPTRQPWLAGTFSTIVPGSGYIYSGRPATGVASFIVNGLLFWAGYDAVRNESYGLASALGFFGMGWYVGNIKGSVNAANEYNFNKRNEYLDKLLNDVDLDGIHMK